MDVGELALAERLHKTPAEIREMPNRDYLDLIAYFQLQAERNHHAEVHARARTRRR